VADGSETHPDWLGGGRIVAPELPKIQSAPTLSMPKSTTVPAASLPLIQPVGKLLEICKGGKMWNSHTEGTQVLVVASPEKYQGFHCLQGNESIKES
jgi:hypothetical protein